MVKENIIYILNPKKLLFALSFEISFIKRFLASAILGNIQRRKFRKLEQFCIFVGYPRSGHSLVAALLDAHPNIVMSMEMDVLWYVKKGFSRIQLFNIIKREAYHFRKIRNNVWTGYSYKVNGGWQGKHDVIKVIGDKQGGRTSLRLNDDPSLIEQLEEKVKLPIKIIHVVRNPFDMITTAVFRKHDRDKLPPPTSLDLLPFINSFLKRARVINELKHTNKYEIFELHHEDLIENPGQHLSKLIKFLKCEPDKKYIEDCSSIINENPHLSRKRIEWPNELITYLEAELKKYPFFSHYTFSN